MGKRVTQTSTVIVLILIVFLTLKTPSLNVIAYDETATPGTYTNPVIPSDFPDPDVLQVADAYYAYATNTEGVNLQVARSTDLIHWELLPDALPVLPEWAAQEAGWVWAPDVSMDGEQFIMYHVAHYKGRQCIGAAISDTPEGPFDPVGSEPLICQTEQGGSIDPASFIDDDGSRYILWKNDGNAVGSRTWIYIQPLAEDGLSVVGEPIQLLTRDERWEGRLIEAPTLWKQDGLYYLFYSANDYSTPKYAVGYAIADQILGPYSKPIETPILATNMAEGIIGPGGQDIIQTSDGQDWMFYHSWMSYGRALNLDELVWTDGVPTITVQRAPQPVP